jgi:subtilase family protein
MYDQMSQHNVRELWRAHQYDAWEAYEYAVVHGAQVLNMSFAWEPTELPLHAPWRIASTNVVVSGVALVAGSGNFRGFYELPEQVRPPASVKAVITTGGTLEDDRISPLSSRGPVTWTRHAPFDDFPLPRGLAKPEVSAPFGYFPVVPFRGRGYQVLSAQAGSSLTSPHVVGVIALMLEQLPELRPDEILDRLVRSSRDVGELGVDPYAGAGLVQAYDAIVLDDLPRLQPTALSWSPQGAGELAFQPGTSMKLTITLANTGATGSGARFTLRTANNGVKIDPPSAAIDRLGTKADVAFSIALGSGLKRGSVVPLTLDVTLASGGRREFDLELPIHGSDLLVVDDDGGGDYEMAWRQSLTRLERPYDLYSIWRQGRATLPDITRYKSVVWLKGEEFVDTVDEKLEHQLSAFVRRGGRLVVSGQNVAADLRNRAVLRDLFGTRFVADLGRTTVLRGAPDTPLAGLEARYDGNNLPDAVAADGSGRVTVSVEQPPGSGLAVTTERTWFLTFELKEVVEPAARDRIVAAILSVNGRSHGVDQ